MDRTPSAAAEPIVILTGAGISKESGLETFRCADGIWSKVHLEDVATPEAFARDPDHVHAFYNARRAHLQDPAIQPNAAHLALARLERCYPGLVLLVTQNVDNLHQRAGSTRCIPMHGELLKVRCLHCQTIHVWTSDLGRHHPCPRCDKTAGLRPHVVWFGEMPLEMDQIYSMLERCGLFLSIGTSGAVYPAAGFVQHVATRGQGLTVEVNLTPSEGAALFDRAHYGPATKVVPEIVDTILEKGISAL